MAPRARGAVQQDAAGPGPRRALLLHAPLAAEPRQGSDRDPAVLHPGRGRVSHDRRHPRPHVYEVYRRVDKVRRRYAGRSARGGRGAANPITYYSMARFVVVHDAAPMDLLHPCSMEAEARLGSFGDVLARVTERLDRP